MPETAQHVNATQAARLIGVNEKTIRLWIKSHKLSAIQAATNRLAIPMSEVERVIREREQAAILDQAPNTRELAQQVAELARQVAELTRQVEALQEEQRASDAFRLDAEIRRRDDLPPARPSRTPATRQSTDNTGRQDLIGLPPGTELASHFAKRHDVDRKTFEGHYKTGKGATREKAPVSNRQKPGREHETEWYVLPEQQQAIRDFWQRHGVPFTPPGNQDQGGQE